MIPSFRFLFLSLLLGLGARNGLGFHSVSPSHCPTSRSRTTTRFMTHPAVVGWPEKYGKPLSSGPQILSPVFAVQTATPEELERLDVAAWPIWTTADKEKWRVGNQNADKIMPYGELSFMISGRLEIIPQETGQAVIVEPGDFVTFPKDFVASWKVLEEVTWHYYLY